MAIPPDSTKPLVTQFNEFRTRLAEIETDIANGVGSGPGTGEEIPGPTYPPQILLVGIIETQLTIPEGANRALVTVTTGVARMGLGDAATAPEYLVSDGVGVAGGELSALRLIRSGTADATVRVDYWQVVDTRAQALADIAEAKADLTASVGAVLTEALTDIGEAVASKPDALAAAAAKPDALAAAAAKPDAQAAAALLPTVQEGIAGVAAAITAASTAASKIAGFTFKVFNPPQVINGVSALLAIADSSGNTAAYWDANGTMYAPGGVIGPLTALTASITTATIATLTALTGTLGGSQFSVLGSGYVAGTRVGFALTGADGSVPFYIDLTGTVFAPGGLNVSNLVVTGTLSLAALTAASGTLGGTQFSLVAGARWANGVLAQQIVQDAAGNVVSYYGPDGKLYVPAGLVAPNTTQGISYAGGRNRIDGVQAVSGPDIVCIGDSLTHGVGQTSYPSYLAALSGRNVANYGLGGQTSTEIAARWGANAVYCSLPSNQIPAGTTPVAVTVYSIDLLRTGAGASMKCTIAGVYGTLTRAASDANNTPFSGAYTFTRDVAGTAVNVPGSSNNAVQRVRIQPDTSALKERLAVIWVGNNNYTEDANIQRDILALIRSLEVMKSRSLVLTMINGNYPGRRANDTPNTDYQAILTTNRNIMNLTYYASDVQKWMPKDPATDVVSAAYRVDDIHHLSAGNELVAQGVWADIQAFGL